MPGLESKLCALEEIDHLCILGKLPNLPELQNFHL